MALWTMDHGTKDLWIMVPCAVDLWTMNHGPRDYGPWDYVLWDYDENVSIKDSDAQRLVWSLRAS